MNDKEAVEALIEECRIDWIIDTNLEEPEPDDDWGGWERIWSPEMGTYVWRKKF